MFTGIIEELGKILAITNNRITIECELVITDAKIGDSIAVNGVCLTVVELLSKGFVADVSPETMRVTSMGNLRVGDFVNLERAMKVDSRFGGHMVSGHIDGLGKFVSKKQVSDFYELEIGLTPELSKYVIKKGSIAINGISLTIAGVNEDKVKIAVIPHTYENTNLKSLKFGEIVNIEIDMVAKYIEKFYQRVIINQE